MMQHLKTIFKKLFKPTPPQIVHYTCPTCSVSISAPLGFPVYCIECDTTYLTKINFTESHPLTTDGGYLSGKAYSGKPKPKDWRMNF
jgi:hypothetical protein